MEATPFAVFVDDPDHAGFVADFDGSLAPIVEDPARSVPLPAARRALEALTGLVARVAVISGRPVDFLQGALGLPGIEYVGLYGMQRVVDGMVVAHPDAAAFVSRVADALAAARRELPGPLVEPKANLAFTLHYRTAPDRAGEVEMLARRLAREYGLLAMPGRLAIELRPPVDVDKGRALLDVTDGLRAVAFAGDDHGDLAAFDALDRMAGFPDVQQVVRIAVQSEESPAELMRRADVVVDGPVGLAGLLEQLAGAISLRRRPAP
ncbi:MAG: trehalose-phosphatase [Acidimicrobiia bacterium]